MLTHPHSYAITCVPTNTHVSTIWVQIPGKQTVSWQPACRGLAGRALRSNPSKGAGCTHKGGLHQSPRERRSWDGPSWMSGGEEWGVGLWVPAGTITGHRWGMSGEVALYRANPPGSWVVSHGPLKGDLGNTTASTMCPGFVLSSPMFLGQVWPRLRRPTGGLEGKVTARPVMGRRGLQPWTGQLWGRFKERSGWPRKSARYL